MPASVQHISAGQHQVFEPQTGVKLHLLHSSSRYQVFLIEVAPGARLLTPAHDGEELRYVLTGTVIFDVGGRQYPVTRGGSLRHPSSMPHGFHTEDGPATFVTFAFSRDYDLRAVIRGMVEGGEHH